MVRQRKFLASLVNQTRRQFNRVELSFILMGDLFLEFFEHVLAGRATCHQVSFHRMTLLKRQWTRWIPKLPLVQARGKYLRTHQPNIMFANHGGWIAQWKHFCFPPSSPGCKSRQCRDFLSLLLSLWTELRSNPSIAKQSISQFQLAVTNRAKYYTKVSPAHAYTEAVWSWCRAFRDR